MQLAFTARMLRAQQEQDVSHAIDRRLFVKISVVVAVLVAVVAFGWKPVLIAYHKRTMARALKKGTWGSGRGGLGEKIKGVVYSAATGRPYRPAPAFDRSRNALVRLGYFERREFCLRHIWNREAAMNLFWAEMTAAFDGTVYIQNLSDISTEVFVLGVWDRPENMPAWEEFIKTHDVPDFMERFGEDAEEARQELLRRSRADP